MTIQEINKLFEKTNTIYKIVDDFDLQKGTLNIGEGSTLDFQGGGFSNGSIVFNNTTITGVEKMSGVNKSGSVKYLYQKPLVSGQNIATINNKNLLDGGNITIDTPTIGTNGNWIINGQDSGKPSKGKDGINGATLEGQVPLVHEFADTPEDLKKAASSAGISRALGGGTISTENKIVHYKTKEGELPHYATTKTVLDENNNPIDKIIPHEIVDPKYIYAITDSEGRIICGILKDGSFDWIKGIPNHVKDFINANLSKLIEDLDKKVDKRDGYSLISNENVNKLNSIESGAQVNTITGIKGSSEETYRKGNISISKENIGLNKVDNTSDVEKPISTIQQQELNKKVNIEEGKGLINNDFSENIKSVNDPKYLYAITDIDGRILVSFDKTGNVSVNRISIEFLKLSKKSINYINNLLNIPDQVKSELSNNQIVPFEKSRFEDIVNKLDSYNIPFYNSTISNESYSLIEIKTQEQFNNIQKLIKDNIIKYNKNILIYLNCEVLYYNEEHINLTLANFPNSENLDIKIIGSPNLSLISGGNFYKKIDSLEILDGYYTLQHEDNYNPNNSYINNKKSYYNESDTRWAESEVIFSSRVDNPNGDIEVTFKFKLNKDDINTKATNVLFTSWYLNYSFKIEKILDGYLYFKNIYKKEPSMKYGWDVNGDFEYCGLFPRYQLLNGEANLPIISNKKILTPISLDEILETTNTNFITISDAFNNIELSNLSFLGNSYIKNKSLIYSDNKSNGSININNNKFENLRSDCILLKNNKINVLISNNKSVNLSRHFIYANETNKCVYFVKNTIDNSNIKINRYGNTSDIFSKSFLISDNIIKNISYIGIRSGRWTKFDDINEDISPTGVIENNLLYHTEDFSRDIWKSGVMDGGQIYIGMHVGIITELGYGIIIRNNTILNIHGMKDNRGIFLDGYAYNTAIYKNIIIGTENSYDINTYHADKSTEQYMEPLATNNLMIYNYLTSFYFMTCVNNLGIKGKNIVFRKDKLKPYKNVISVSKEEDDYIVEDSTINGFQIFAPVWYKEIIKDLPLNNKQKYVINFNKL